MSDPQPKTVLVHTTQPLPLSARVLASAGLGDGRIMVGIFADDRRIASWETDARAWHALTRDGLLDQPRHVGLIASETEVGITAQLVLLVADNTAALAAHMAREHRGQTIAATILRTHDDDRDAEDADDQTPPLTFDGLSAYADAGGTSLFDEDVEFDAEPVDDGDADWRSSLGAAPDDEILAVPEKYADFSEEESPAPDDLFGVAVDILAIGYTWREPEDYQYPGELVDEAKSMLAGLVSDDNRTPEQRAIDDLLGAL